MSYKVRENLERSIVAATQYILALQKDNGCWIDWKLPVGESDSWVTAYVGYKLQNIPNHLKSMIEHSENIASTWILRKQGIDAGWGYNGSVESDADSIACSILFIDSVGKRIPTNAYKRLEQFQCLDGGFCTYLTSNNTGSWRMSHPDVTPTALLALLTKYQYEEEPRIAEGIKYILENQRADGIWNSFWWDSPLFSTTANLALLHKIKNMNIDLEKISGCLKRIRPKNSFETSLLLSSALYSDQESTDMDYVSNLTTQLLSQQLPDGSWLSEPILRLTRQDCYEPWEDVYPGSLYLDPNRLMTTATSLESLCRLYSLC